MEFEINTNKSKYVKGGTNRENFPEWDLPEVVLSGRSNVGKSSFINKMLGINGIAKVSASPGKTRVLNFFDIDSKLSFVDVPGYGYAKVSKSEMAAFANMIDEYIKYRTNLRQVILLVDSRHNPTQDDIDMYRFLKHNGKPVLIVATKWDKLNQKERAQAKKNIVAKLGLDSVDQFVPFSSETGVNKDLIWGYILEACLGK